LIRVIGIGTLELQDEHGIRRVHNPAHAGDRLSAQAAQHLSVLRCAGRGGVLGDGVAESSRQASQTRRLGAPLGIEGDRGIVVAPGWTASVLAHRLATVRRFSVIAAPPPLS
jgi:hypothetical protein